MESKNWSSVRAMTSGGSMGRGIFGFKDNMGRGNDYGDRKCFTERGGGAQR